MKTLLKIPRGIFSASVLFFTIIASPAFAAGPVITNTAGVRSELCNVFSIMFEILIVVSVIMVLWAAYLYATAGDDTEQVTQAKRAIFYAAIGIIVAFLANGFPLLVGSIFPGVAGLQGC